MNAKTVKLIKRYAAGCKPNVNDVKRAWKRYSATQRANVRGIMQAWVQFNKSA